MAYLHRLQDSAWESPRESLCSRTRMQTVSAVIQALEAVLGVENKAPSRQESSQACSRIFQGQRSLRESLDSAQQDAQDLGDVFVILDAAATYHDYKTIF